MNLLQRMANRLRGTGPQDAKISESDVQSDPATANTRPADAGKPVGMSFADEPENEKTGAEARAEQAKGLRDGASGNAQGGGAPVVGGGGSGNPPGGRPSNAPGGPHGNAPGSTPSNAPDGGPGIAPDGSPRTTSADEPGGASGAARG